LIRVYHVYSQLLQRNKAHVLYIGVITHQEFQDMNTLLIDSYLYEMGRSHPRHRERFSEQTWLTQEHEDGILQDIRLR